MTPLLTISTETKDLLEAIDAFADEVLDPYLKAAALETGHAVATEGARRHRRRTAPTQEEASRRAVGSSAASIVVEDRGHEVIVQANTDPANLDLWLAFGTRLAEGEGFLISAARLEAGSHRRRCADALDRAIAETFGRG